MPERRVVVLADAAEQARAQPWVEMDCCQLTPGRFSGRLAARDLGEGVCVVEERQSASVHKAGATPPSFCTFSVAEMTDARTPRFGEYSGAAAASVFFLAGGTEFDVYIPAGMRTRYIGLDQDTLIDTARLMAPRHWERPPQGIRTLSGADAADFSAVAGAALDAGVQRRIRRALIDGLALLLVDAANAEDPAGPPGHGVRRQSSGRLRRARAHIDACLEVETVPTVAELCAALGVCERTLQYTFRDAFDMTPVAYLRVVRLNRVRAMLRDPAQAGRTVTDIAMRWGFLHLGRFAGDYRRMFGETPAQTRASAACAR